MQDNPIVGHGTLADGTHVPIRKSEADAIWAAVEKEREERAAQLPDMDACLKMLGRLHSRLTDLGWRDAIYCPKDGSAFQVIEFGSTGIHTAHYEGKWPDGTWWVHDPENRDMWPSRPILFKLPEDSHD